MAAAETNHRPDFTLEIKIEESIFPPFGLYVLLLCLVNLLVSAVGPWGEKHWCNPSSEEELSLVSFVLYGVRGVLDRRVSACSSEARWHLFTKGASHQCAHVCVCGTESALSYRLNLLRTSVRTRNKWVLRLKDCLWWMMEYFKVCCRRGQISHGWSSREHR